MNRTSILLIVTALLISGCSAGKSERSMDTTSTVTEPGSVVLAVNVGGDAYLSKDGIDYEPDRSSFGGYRGQIDGVKGSQDPTLYQTFRGGDVRVDADLANGVYDVVLHFAEPDSVGGGERVFNAVINQQMRIEDLDVMAWRDGKVRSALTVTVANVLVEDNALEVRFEALVGEPVLSAVVVRTKVPRSPEWTLVWGDEFDYEGAPDPDKWSHNVWPARKVNNEDQTYTDRLRNVRVQDGSLIVEAHREDFNEAQYTSGRIHSAGKGDFLYGRFEARAKVPQGQGTWPAIWMLPSKPFTYATTCDDGVDWQGNADCDAWPNSGEIDILEHVGFQMGHIHGTVHNRAYYWVNWEQRKGRLIDPLVDQEYRVYAVEWSEDRIDMFVDDTLYFTYMNEGSGWKAWPYDHKFHLIINVAMGGAWGSAGGPTDDSALPQKLMVDYVRVYQKTTSN